MASASKMPEEVRGIVRRYRNAFVTVAILSAILNFLVLGGSLYMMLIYDSVLPSHSLPTLFGLLALLVGVYAFQGIFDALRSRILADVGSSFDRAMSHRVQHAMFDSALMGAHSEDSVGPMRDLENIRTFLTGPGPATLIDLPWILFFIGILMMIQIWTGLTALIGGALLVGLTIVTNRVTKGPMARLGMLTAYRNAQAQSNVRHIEILTALGMRGRMLDRWQQMNDVYLSSQRTIGKSLATLGGISKIGRMLLQSLILTVGAIMVIRGEASGGAIFASSILSGRALAPVDQAIGNWRSLAAARIGWQRLCALLQHVPPRPDIRTILPKPSRELSVEQLYIAPPGGTRMTVQGANFAMKAGDGLAIIGPSAAGKSSLGRALIGIWKPARGAVRLDGASLDQWPGDLLGESIGYLPQTVELLEGTVAENIARFEAEPRSEDVIAAATAAGVHDMIIALPQGYETPVGPDGRELSAGQQQRIGLARALYRDPFLVMLDEPNSNLDAVGDAALERAIGSVRARGGIVIVIAHRPSALTNINLVMVMRDGRVEAVGPRDEVLQKIVSRPVPIRAGQTQGGSDAAGPAAAAGGF